MVIDMLQSVPQSVHDTIGQLLNIPLVPREHLERDRIGCIAHPFGLVDIESYAKDGIVDTPATQTILNQYTRQLTVAHVDVVRPLDLHV